MVSQAAVEGDVIGMYAFNKIGEWLGRTMASISAVLDPDIYVIGGGLSPSVISSWNRPGMRMSVSSRQVRTGPMQR